jgi:CRP/FNR family transcriptional regulator
MSRVDMGNYLGLAVETVSRTLTKLQQRGVIKVEGKEVTILDFDGLTCLNTSFSGDSSAALNIN